MNKAIFLKHTTPGKALYKLVPPMVEVWADMTGTYEHVIVSAITFPYEETYIFPASSEGEICDFMELNGSYRGGLSHEEALRGAGYEISNLPYEPQA